MSLATLALNLPRSGLVQPSKLVNLSCLPLINSILACDPALSSRYQPGFCRVFFVLLVNRNLPASVASCKYIT